MKQKCHLCQSLRDHRIVADYDLVFSFFSLLRRFRVLHPASKGLVVRSKGFGI